MNQNLIRFSRVSLSLLAFILSSATAFAAEEVSFGPISGGALPIEGRGFTKRVVDGAGRPLRVSVVQSFKQLASVPLAADGSFTYTITKEALLPKSRVWVEVVMYVDSYTNFVSKDFMVPDPIPADPAPDFDPNASFTAEVRGGELRVQGQRFSSNVKPSLVARILIGNEEIGTAPIGGRDGRFLFTAKDRAKGRDTIRVVVADYRGIGQDLDLSGVIPYWHNEAATVQYGAFKDGQMTVVGRGFATNTAPAVKIAFYADSALIREIETGKDGNFSFTTPKGSIQSGQSLKVQVRDYFDLGRDFVRIQEVPYLYDRDARVEFGSYERGQVTIVGRDIRRTDRPDLMARILLRRASGSFQLSSVKINSNGSFSYTSPTGEVVCGDRLTVIVDDYFDGGKDFSSVKELPAQGYGCWNWVPEAKLRPYAEAQADLVFDRLAATYAARENYRQNIVYGFWSGVRTGENDSASYGAGNEDGSSDAREPGGSAGLEASRREAETRGAADSKERFLALLEDESATPDLTVRIPRVDFSGIRTTDPYRFDIRDALTELQSQQWAQIDRSWSQSGLQLRLSEAGSEWSFATIYSYSGPSGYPLDTSWARPDAALERWEENRIGYSFDQRLFRELSPEQRLQFREIFRNEFAEIYRRERDRLNRPDSELRWKAETIGRRLGQKIAYEKGRTHGYLLGYEIAAETAAQRAFGGDYTREFQHGVSYLPGALSSGRSAGARVANTYGRREIFIRNFHNGFKDGFAEGRVASTSNPKYVEGVAAGKRDASSLAQKTGNRIAEERSESLAPADVRKRFVEATERGDRRPDLEARPPKQSYDGDSLVRKEIDMAASIERFQPQLSSELIDTVRFEEAGLVAGFTAASALQLKTIYNNAEPVDYTVKTNYLSGEFGLREFRSKKLGELDYAQAAKLTGSHRGNFEAMFSASFGKRAQARFKELDQSRPGGAISGQSFGHRYGLGLGGSYSGIVGSNDGFNATYREATKSEFQKAFPGAYQEAFDRKSRFYIENPVLVIEQGRLIDGSGDFIFEAREKVGVRLTKLMNIGMVAARDVPYSLSGESLEQAPGTQPSGTFSVEGLTLQPKFDLKDLAQIRKNTSDRKVHPVQFSINGKETQLSYRLGWNALLEQFASAGEGDSELSSMREAVISVLAKDWSIYWIDRGWFSNDANSKLGQLVGYFEALKRDPDGQLKRARLTTLYAEIVKIPPQSPASSKEKKAKADFLRWSERLKVSR